MSGRDDHWEAVYAASPSNGLSWYEREPATSLRLIQQASTRRSAGVIDVGAGTSSLVDRLVDQHYTDITVLDVSEHALSEVQQRIGDRTQHVTFVHQDVVRWKPHRQYDIWHDRAVFHFIVDGRDRDRYVEIASSAIRNEGALVLAAFAEDGPTKCSGLPASRYTAHDLADTFSPSFVLAHHERVVHVTPAGVVQPFTWVVFRRVRRE